MGKGKGIGRGGSGLWVVEVKKNGDLEEKGHMV